MRAVLLILLFVARIGVLALPLVTPARSLSKVERIILVDSKLGDDVGALRGVQLEGWSMHCPFQTISAAITAIGLRQDGAAWTIVVTPGIYASDTLNITGQITIRGDSVANTIITGRIVFSGPLNAMVQDVTIWGTTANQPTIVTRTGGVLTLRNVVVNHNITSTLSAIVVQDNSQVHADRVTVLVEQKQATAITVIAGGIEANNMLLIVRGQSQATALTLEEGTEKVSLHNSVVNITFANTDGTSSFVRLVGTTNNLQLSIDNNKITFFATTITGNAKPYDAFNATGTVLSRSNSFRDGNNNIAAMVSIPSNLNIVSLDDQVNIVS